MRTFPSRPSLALIVLILLVSSCSKQPYDYTLTKVNESDPQQKALILISSPQIYARETLADDRRREAEFLEQLLKDSKDVQFEPQLRRELASISAFSSQLGLSFDPTRSTGFTQAKEIGGLEQEVRTAQLHLQLQQLQKQISALESGEVAPPPLPTPNTPVGVSPPSTFSPPTSESLKAQAEELRAHIDRAIQQLKSISGEVKPTTIRSSPQEAFRDKQAYRNELRAALGAVNLDDIHDAEGNALFQFQFRATVLPGKAKDKYGATRLTMQAPTLDLAYLNDLYRRILMHVSFQANFSLGSEPSSSSRLNYEELGRASGLFELIRVYASDSPSKISDCIKTQGSKDYPCFPLYIAVPRIFTEELKELGITEWDAELAALEVQLKNVLTTREKFPEVQERQAPLIDGAMKVCTLPGSSVQEFMNSKPDDKFVRIIAHWLYAEPLFTEAVEGAKAKNRLEEKPELRDATNKLLLEFQELFRSRLRTESTVMSLIPSLRDHKPCKYLDKSSLNIGTVQFPDQFGRTLIAGYDQMRFEKKQSGLPAKGDVFVYSAGPVEQVQRVSTMTSAVDALQLTMALSAVVPAYGVGINQSLGAMQHALGKAEALERAPIVVGFSSMRENPISSTPGQRPYLPNFGWIFGPRIALDPHEQQLRLEQTVATHQVTAEVSAPAWWPRVLFNVENAWVHNWHAAEGAIPLDLFESSGAVTSQKLTAPLPIRSADLETLLLRIAKESTGRSFDTVKITGVYPQKVSRCNKQLLTFLIYGPEVWRTTKAYLGGSAHKDIQILPDMQGVSVQFDLTTIPRFAEEAKLTVATRRGHDEYPIAVVGGIDGKSCGDELPSKPFTISSVTPIALCGDTVDVLVALKGPFKPVQIASMKFFLGSLQAKDVVKISPTTFLVKFDKKMIPPPNDGFINMTVIIDDAITSSNVPSLDGPCGMGSEKLKVMSAFSVPPQRVNVCSARDVTLYVVGKQFDSLKDVMIRVPFKEGDINYPAVSSMVSKPEGILEAKFAFRKLEGKQLSGDSFLVVKTGTGAAVTEHTAPVSVMCQPDSAKTSNEDKTKEKGN